MDEEHLVKPKPWDIKAITKFMLFFGPISSIFDFVTYAILLFVFRASIYFFHTGWVTESLIAQTLVIHIIRTAKIPFLQSMASGYLLLTSIVIILIGLSLPYSPLAKSFGFVQLPSLYYLCLLGIVLGYLSLVQIMKSYFVRKIRLLI